MLTGAAVWKAGAFLQKSKVTVHGVNDMGGWWMETVDLNNRALSTWSTGAKRVLLLFIAR